MLLCHDYSSRCTLLVLSNTGHNHRPSSMPRTCGSRGETAPSGCLSSDSTAGTNENFESRFFFPKCVSKQPTMGRRSRGLRSKQRRGGGGARLSRASSRGLHKRKESAGKSRNRYSSRRFRQGTISDLVNTVKHSGFSDKTAYSRWKACWQELREVHDWKSVKDITAQQNVTIVDFELRLSMLLSAVSGVFDEGDKIIQKWVESGKEFPPELFTTIHETIVEAIDGVLSKVNFSPLISRMKNQGYSESGQTEDWVDPALLNSLKIFKNCLEHEPGSLPPSLQALKPTTLDDPESQSSR